jgi:uncharacterized alpha-E superfamily protein/transglutaminase-like putative cysteine protease
LLSRYAENAFWMGRYMERCENIARLLSVTEAYAEGSDARVNWLPLLEVNADAEAFAETGLALTGLNVARWYLADPKNPNSVLASLERVRENARGLRHLISVEVWRQINMFHGAVKALNPRKVKLSQLDEVSERVRASCQEHFGLVETTWYRDEAWLFNRLGVRMERADQSTRLLDIKSYQLGEAGPDRPLGGQPDDAWWNTLLRSASGYHAFRRSGPVNPQPDAAAEFILFDSAFPRSVEGCVQEAVALLDRLETGYGVLHGEAVQEARDTLRALLSQRPDSLSGDALHAYLDQIQLALIDLGSAVAARHFDPARPAERAREASDEVSASFQSQIVSDHVAPTRAMPTMMAEVLHVRHLTRYRYRRPVVFNEHHGMFRPHTSHDTRLLDLRFNVTPGAKIRWVHDVFSNAATVFNFAPEPADTLEVECVFRVRRGAQHQPDFPIAPHARRYPFAYGAEELIDLTPLIVPDYDPDGVVLNWARRFVEEAEFDTWGILERMTTAVKAEFAYDRREEAGVQPAAETVLTRRGSCRDFAVLMVEGVRRLGIAARFVSGYLYDPALDTGYSGQGGMQGAGSTHAWVQVFLPGAGWVEFDPTNGLIGSRNLIRTSVGRTPSQAVPLAGSFDGAAEDFIGMEVEVEVTSHGEEV